MASSATASTSHSSGSLPTASALLLTSSEPPLDARVHNSVKGGFGPYLIIPRVQGKPLVGTTAKIYGINFSSSKEAREKIETAKAMLSHYQAERERGQSISFIDFFGRAFDSRLPKSASLNPLEALLQPPENVTVEAFQIFPSIDSDHYFGEVGENFYVDFSTIEEAQNAFSLFDLALKTHQAAQLVRRVDSDDEDFVTLTHPSQRGARDYGSMDSISVGRSAVTGKPAHYEDSKESKLVLPRNYTKACTLNPDGTKIWTESWAADESIPPPPPPDGVIGEPVVFLDGASMVRQTHCQGDD